MKNKTILFLGDSITEGAITTNIENSYVNVVKKLSGASVINYGVSGTRIARQTEQHLGTTKFNYDFNLRAEIMQSEADYVVVFGGVNDYGHGVAPLGNEDDETVYTFYGAVKSLYSKLKTKYVNAKIVVILPLNSAMDEPEKIKHGIKVTLSDYREIIRKVATKNGFNILDLTNVAELNPLIEENNNKYFSDGLHPNDSGHSILGQKVYEFLINI